MIDRSAERYSIRKAYGKTLVELGNENPDIVVLDADLSKSTQTAMFGEKFPDRFYNCGIAEANMVSIAAGLSCCGKIPFISSFAVFLICKGYDQLRMSVAYPECNVKVVATHGGISVGEDGPSQHSVEDLALMLSLPGFRVVVPADDIATASLVRCMAGDEGPIYMRLTRPDSVRIHDPGDEFHIGGSKFIRRGSDVTVVSMGFTLWEAVQAAEELETEGIDVDLIDMYSVRPLDAESLLASIDITGGVVVVEEHQYHGGLGSEIAQFLARVKPVPIEFVNIGERYAESGKPTELLEKYGVSSRNIVEASKRLIQRKKAG
jgi:transketolase